MLYFFCEKFSEDGILKKTLKKYGFELELFDNLILKKKFSNSDRIVVFFGDITGIACKQDPTIIESYENITVAEIDVSIISCFPENINNMKLLKEYIVEKCVIKEIDRIFIKNSICYNEFQLCLKREKIKYPFRTKIKIISLENSLYRFEHAVKEICSISEKYPGLPWNFFSAVDGKKILKSECFDDKLRMLKYNREHLFYHNSNNRINMNMPQLTDEELGCLMSHYILYENLLKEEDEIDSYIILEDDFIINNEIELLKLLYLGGKNDKFDIGLLGVSLFPPLRRDGNKVDDIFLKMLNETFTCAASYIITKRGAKKITDRVNKILTVPTDDMLACLFKEKSIEVVVSKDIIFRYSKELKSTIASHR